MHIEKELSLWLDENIPRRRRNKSRDAQAVLMYYGFGDIDWPTLEQIGEQLSIGTRQRVQQVLKAAFKTEALIEYFPALQIALREIGNIDFESIPNIRKRLIRLGVISPGTRIRGVLNLGNDLGAVGDYEFVDHNLNRLSRSEAEFDEKTFLGTKSAIVDLRKAYRKAKMLPGSLGLATQEYLKDKIGVKAADHIWRLMELDAEAEVIEVDDQKWYIFEDWDNTLVNSCAKVASLSSDNDAQVLADTLCKALHGWTSKYVYPSPEVICKWIYQSKWFEITDGIASFLGSPRSLTEIEDAVVSYLAGKGPSKYSPLKNHLLELGFGKSYVDKTILASPLVYVDKSAVRTKYTYTLISEVGLTRPSVDLD